MGAALYENAVEEFQRALELQPSEEARSNLAWAYAKVGKRDEAARMLEQLLASAEREAISWDFITQVQVALGRIDDAYVWWDRAYLKGDRRALRNLRCNPAYDEIRSDARFQELVRRFEQGSPPSSALTHRAGPPSG